MLTKTVLSADDLAGLIAAIFAYNRRGEVQGVQWFGPEGQPIQLGWVEAITDTPGLVVRTVPERSPEEVVQRMTQAEMDPRTVLTPTGFSDLAKLLESAQQ